MAKQRLKSPRARLFIALDLPQDVRAGLVAWQQTALNMGYPQSEWPDFRLLLDPIDFLVPQVWSPGDPRWFHAEKGARVAQLCH